jgi:hypothetical protein
MREQLLQRRKQGLIILAECVLAREDLERKLAMIRSDLDAIDKALSIPVEAPNETPPITSTPR